MALSKLTFLGHLKSLAKPYWYAEKTPSLYAVVRCLAFATPEEAAAERRRRKRRLRMEPPLNALNRNQQQQQYPSPKPIQNPNAPKLPEPVSSLSGNRLNLHNKILVLIRQNDLEEAALYTRHSVYSNCRPTIYTVNAVLTAQLRQSKYTDLLSLHRFITQAGIAPNIITYNLIFQTYLDCRKPDTALEHYKQLINNAPFNPAPTTYRILIKGLVDNGKLDKAMELKEEMVVKDFAADPVVYSYLMIGHMRNSDADGVFKLYEELNEKSGCVVKDGVLYGNLMKGYFMKGMEKEAMDYYEEAVGADSVVRMNAVAYNYVLDALSKNGKFDEALRLFNTIKKEHNPPTKLSVNLGTFNVMVDGYCAESQFSNAIDTFKEMGNYRCSPDTLSFNNLMNQLCKNGKLVEAEEMFGDMSEKGVSPDEYTFGMLMDTCFEENRTDDGASYFTKMVESGLRPNLELYNKLISHLVKVEKIDEAKSFFDLMFSKLKMDDASYKFIMKALSEAGRLDEVLKIVDGMLDDEAVEFSEELQEFVKDELRNEGREEELTQLMEEKERQKAEAKAKEAEAAEAAKRSTRAAVSSLIPSKLFGNKESESNSTIPEAVVEEESAKTATINETETKSNVVVEQQVTA